MTKRLTIAILLCFAAIVLPTARAAPAPVERIIAQESLGGPAVEPSEPTMLDAIAARHRGRAEGPALVDPATRPVQVVGVDDGFDWGDAGIGGAASLATALLGAAGLLIARRRAGRDAKADRTLRSLGGGS